MAAPLLVRAPGWALGLRTGPVWSESAIVLSHGSSLLPGMPGFLDPNAGWTTEALGSLAARQWLSGAIPWWDPFSGIGLPLAAEMQSSALFLPYILLLTLPGGYTLLTLAIQWTAGLAMWRLLRRLNLDQMPAFAGAIMFELCGSFAWLGPPMILPMPFLPLFLLGIEQAYAAARAGMRGGWRLIAVAVALSLYAGFPEVAYLDGLLALLWAACGLAAMPGPRRLQFARCVAGGGLVGLLLAAPLLWPFLDLLTQATTGPRETIDMSLLALLPEGLVQLLTPYALGLPAGLTGVDPTPNNALAHLWGRVPGYAGTTLALAGLVGAFVPGPNRRLRWILLAWTTFVLARVTGVPGARTLWSIVPFHHTLQIFRYSGAAWLLPSCILAAHALHVRPASRLIWAGAAAIAVLAVGLAIPAWPFAAMIPTAATYFAAALAWAALSVAALAIALASGRRLMAAFILVVDALVLSAVPLVGAGRPRPRLDAPAIQFLQSHLGLQRVVTLGPLAPNYGALFEIASVNSAYLPTPTVWADHVEAKLRPGGTPVLFTGAFPPDTPGQPTNAEVLAAHLRDYADLGVRYVLAPPRTNPFRPPLAPPGSLVPRTLTHAATFAGRLTAEAREVAGLDVTVGTFAGAASGDLLIDVCANLACAHGQASLVGIPDNAPLTIPISPALSGGGELTWSLRHPSGNDVAVYFHGDAPEVSPAYKRTKDDPVRVYADDAVWIYDIGPSAPYVSVTGGPCTLVVSSRTRMVADCQANAMLIRRELMVPGWRAHVGAAEIAPGPVGPFQSVPLPSGRSSVSFRYLPPGAPAFITLFAVGLGLLLPWDRVIARQRRTIS